MEENYLIVGLGNPGKEYEKTRHNVGFMVLDALCAHYQMEFRLKEKVQGWVATKEINGKRVFLLKPKTYMNLSGESVRSAVDFWKIGISNLLVVADDAEILFEEFRLKRDSGSGGHNGLKSIESSLGTNAYARLRVGIGKNQDLSDHVLTPFTEEESKKLREILEKARGIIELWMFEGIYKAMNCANIRAKEKLLKREDLE
ncbi:MAG: aminoacyl-tRNA hydrolase [Chlamydiota bacterium]